MEINFKETITYKACDEILEIAKDFFNLTGITYFNFVRAYDDGTRLYLTNSRAWAEFIFENHAKYHFAFEESTDNLTSQYLIWDLIPAAKADELIKIAREDFDIDHGMTLINRYDDYTEFCYFATGKNNAGVNQFYINNIDLLKSFILYFKDRANKLINLADKQRFFLKSHSLFWLDIKEDGSVCLKDFFKYCNIKRFFLDGALKDTHLTRREAECLTYLFDGKSPKQIANIIGISHRTIEGYIEEIKLKMRCNSKSQLLEIAKKNGFAPIYESIKAELERNQ